MARISYRWHQSENKTRYYDKICSPWSRQSHMKFTWLMCPHCHGLPRSIISRATHSVATAHLCNSTIAGDTLKVNSRRSFFLPKYLCSTSKTTVKLFQHAAVLTRELQNWATQCKSCSWNCDEIVSLLQNIFTVHVHFIIQSCKSFGLSQSTTNHQLQLRFATDS